MNSIRCMAVVAITCLTLIANDVVMAQPDDGRQQRGRGFRNLFDNSLAVLMRGDVQEELGLAEQQIEEIESLQRDSRETMREMFQRGREEGRGFDWESMQDEIQERMKELEDQANDILLPHQIERLQQIVLQTRQQRGTTSALTSIKDKLGLSDKQMEELQQKSQEAQQEYQEKIAQARKEMEDDILSVLTSEQRAKYKEMMGEKFEQRNNNRFRRGGGRGNDDDNDDRDRRRRNRDRSDF